MILCTTLCLGVLTLAALVTALLCGGYLVYQVVEQQHPVEDHPLALLGFFLSALGWGLGTLTTFLLAALVLIAAFGFVGLLAAVVLYFLVGLVAPPFAELFQDWMTQLDAVHQAEEAAAEDTLAPVPN